MLPNIKLPNIKNEITTIWSFPQRGKWATHNSKYRGNFAPEIARNLILKYSEVGDVVLDPMVGGGTTLIECKLLNRKGIGIDINPKAVNLTLRNLDLHGNYNFDQEVFIGDARDLSMIKNESIDFVIVHPPYANIIRYSNGECPGDLSTISSIEVFLREFDKVIKEVYRVLKCNKYCAILIGDTRKHKHYVPLSYYVLRCFLENNFVLKESIIKTQHNCLSTSFWAKKAEELNILLIAHEHLFVFRKPFANEVLDKFKYSRML